MICSRRSLFLLIIPSLVYFDFKSFSLINHKEHVKITRQTMPMLYLLRVAGVDFIHETEGPLRGWLWASRWLDFVGESDVLLVDVFVDFLASRAPIFAPKWVQMWNTLILYIRLCWTFHLTVVNLFYRELGLSSWAKKRIRLLVVRFLPCCCCRLRRKLRSHLHRGTRTVKFRLMIIRAIELWVAWSLG